VYGGQFLRTPGKKSAGGIHIKAASCGQARTPWQVGAQKVDYVADEAYEVTPLHPGLPCVNKAPGAGLNRWEVGVTQDVKRKGSRVWPRGRPSLHRLD